MPFPQIPRWCALGAALMAAAPAGAWAEAAAGPEAEIRARLEGWAEAFNRRDDAAVCDLFAEDLVSTVRGAPDSGKAEVCARLGKALGDRARDLTYAPAIEEILPLPSGDMALVRVTWTLGLEEAGAVTTTDERGMDLFRRDPDGVWRIARFMAFSTAPDE